MSDQLCNKVEKMSSRPEQPSQSFSPSKERSLWYRVPKSKVILKKHYQGFGNNSSTLIRLAAKNSAKFNRCATSKPNNSDSELINCHYQVEEPGDELMRPTPYQLSRAKLKASQSPIGETFVISKDNDSKLSFGAMEDLNDKRKFIAQLYLGLSSLNKKIAFIRCISYKHA